MEKEEEKEEEKKRKRKEREKRRCEEENRENRWREFLRFFLNGLIYGLFLRYNCIFIFGYYKIIFILYIIILLI